jgi:hypothetical protein
VADGLGWMVSGLASRTPTYCRRIDCGYTGAPALTNFDEAEVAVFPFSRVEELRTLDSS